MSSTSIINIENILKNVSCRLNEASIPYALIGAMALGLYGLPRYTSDIDLISDVAFLPSILKIMEQLGYNCYHKTEVFAQFDSEGGGLGRIDFILASTPDGREIIARRVIVDDDLLGRQPVVQPTDYIILKLMAIANDEKRRAMDEADISTIIRLSQNQMVHKRFEALNIDQLARFAKRFGQAAVLEKFLTQGGP